MSRTFWNSKIAMCGLTAIALGLGVVIGTQAQSANSPSPLKLPGHRYDLPATKISAAQIEAHKQSMLAVKETDVAMTMSKLSSSYWRLVPSMCCTVPPAVRRCCQAQHLRHAAQWS